MPKNLVPRRWYIAPDGVGRYQCARCHEFKLAGEFELETDGLSKHCVTCQRETRTARAYRSTPPKQKRRGSPLEPVDIDAGDELTDDDLARFVASKV